MKKVVFLIAICALFLTGCGSKDKLVCSGKTDMMGYSVEAKVTAEFKNDKVSDVKAELVFDDEDTAKSMCSMFELANSMAGSEEEKMSIECKGKSLVFKDFSQLIEDEETNEKVIGMSKADFIKEMEETENVTCK